jgi:hypothetical protein
MKTLWILAAAATFAACHNRSDETGAAPDRGDSASVKSGYDTTKTAPAPTPAPAPADTGVKTDTTSQTVPQTPTYDTTSTTVPQSSTYDTTATTPSANPAPGATTDTTMAPMPHDSSSAPR